MKRHPSLHPLSEHHHHALVCALELRRAAEAAPEDRGPQARKAAENFLRFWNETGSRHFREEEEFVLPIYSRHKRLDEDPDVMGMLAEHAAIRARALALDEARGDAQATEKVIALVEELGPLLNEHVRREEDRIFPAIEQVLGKEEIEWLGERLSWLHRKK